MRVARGALFASLFAGACGGRAVVSDTLPVVSADAFEDGDGGLATSGDASVGSRGSAGAVYGAGGEPAFRVAEAAFVQDDGYDHGHTVWIRLTDLPGACAKFVYGGEVRGETNITLRLRLDRSKSLMTTYPIDHRSTFESRIPSSYATFTSTDDGCRTFGYEVQAVSGYVTLTGFEPLRGDFEIQWPDRTLRGSFVASQCELTRVTKDFENCAF